MTTKVMISIVDDDGSVREATMNLMKALGYDSAAFASAEEFLASERRYTTSFLIADVQMPGMTGLELHRRLASSDRPVPTVLITAHADECTRTNALKAGVVGFLTKPFAEEDLLGCIDAALEGRNRNEAH